MPVKTKAFELTAFPEGFDEAVNFIERGECSCAVFKRGAVARTVDGRGVAPLIEMLNEGEILRGAAVADKIIGRAAAMILELGGACAVYGHVMSEGARDYLISRGMACAYNTLVKVIEGRDGAPMCPIERAVLGTDDAHEGLALIKKRLAELRDAKMHINTGT